MDGFRKNSYCGLEGNDNALGLDANAAGHTKGRPPPAPRRHRAGGSSPSLRLAVCLPPPQGMDGRPQLEGYCASD